MSSWLRAAVSKAVEVSGKRNLTRTVREAIAHHADKILQDRYGSKNLRSFKHTAKRLEELSVSCRGIERVQLLRRWLVSLKEIGRLTHRIAKNSGDLMSEGSKDDPGVPTMVYYYDSDLGDEPRNYRDLFLYSQALEGMALSMILEAPNEEEVSVLMEIFGLCLTGGKEAHTAIMSSIKELAQAFVDYEDEILVKREELLQYAQDAIAGLKMNSEISRIDAEASDIKDYLDKSKELQKLSGEVPEQPSEITVTAAEDPKEVLTKVQYFTKLEALLLRKKSLGNGDTPQRHAEKIDKLKILLESLANSTSKAEKRISDQRCQKEEAVNFRVSKDFEVSQTEKDLRTEIAGLQKQKDELEDELSKVNASLTSAQARLKIAREEHEQFDEANNELLVHLKSKEDELSKAKDSYRKEADIVNVWIGFLGNTWALQCSYLENKENEVNGELERYQSDFLDFVIHLLSIYETELMHSATNIGRLVETLRASQAEENVADSNDETSRKKLEKEIVEAEAKFLSISSVVETIKKHFRTPSQGTNRTNDQKVKELFDNIEKIKDNVESIKRPLLENETSTQMSPLAFSTKTPTASTPTSEVKQGNLKSESGKDNKKSSSVETETQSQSARTELDDKLSNDLANTSEQFTKISQYKQDERTKTLLVEVENILDAGAKPANVEPKSGTVNKDSLSAGAETLIQGSQMPSDDEVTNSSLAEKEKAFDAEKKSIPENKQVDVTKSSLNEKQKAPDTGEKASPEDTMTTSEQEESTMSSLNEKRKVVDAERKPPSENSTMTSENKEGEAMKSSENEKEKLLDSEKECTSEHTVKNSDYKQDEGTNSSSNEKEGAPGTGGEGTSERTMTTSMNKQDEVAVSSPSGKEMGLDAGSKDAPEHAMPKGNKQEEATKVSVSVKKKTVHSNEDSGTKEE